MKKHLSLFANILLILTGLLGLRTIDLSVYIDNALLQPFYIVFLIAALYGQIVRIRETLSFLTPFLNLIFGIVGFIFIFPFKNDIVGYVSLAAIIFIMIWPLVKKVINRKKIVTIKV
ncbi:hypothetical protein JW911_04800 [Candidatus Peregrinibacteria bacterium]|nr:hypothetical protein [Candidatus Peregrinibacteria bacterium]